MGEIVTGESSTLSRPPNLIRMGRLRLSRKLLLMKLRVLLGITSACTRCCAMRLSCLIFARTMLMEATKVCNVLHFCMVVMILCADLSPCIPVTAFEWKRVMAAVSQQLGLISFSGEVVHNMDGVGRVDSILRSHTCGM